MSATDECEPQHEHELDQDDHHQHRRGREQAVVHEEQPQYRQGQEHLHQVGAHGHDREHLQAGNRTS